MDNNQKSIQESINKIIDMVNKKYHNVEISVSLKNLADFSNKVFSDVYEGKVPDVSKLHYIVKELKRISDNFDKLGYETFGKVNHDKVTYDLNEHKVIAKNDDKACEDDSSVCGHCCEECSDNTEDVYDIDKTSLHQSNIISHELKSSCPCDDHDDENCDYYNEYSDYEDMLDNLRQCENCCCCCGGDDEDYDDCDEDYYYDENDEKEDSQDTIISFNNCNFIFGDPYQIETFIKSLKNNKGSQNMY